MKVCLMILLYFPSKSIELEFGPSKIVNGFTRPSEPKRGEYPHHAALLLYRNGTELIFCGGSLIHPRWILSAAHCLEQDGKQFPSYLLRVALGSIYSNLRGAHKSNVVGTYIHPEYYSTGGNHDVGLLKLTKSIELTNAIKPIPLHTNNNETLLGQLAYLSGLGLINDFFQEPERLRTATLHINSPSRCYLKRGLDEYQICCTSTIKEGKACKGDSGGALVVKRNDKMLQVGITSHLSLLPLCKLTFNHSVYSRVSYYVKWIAKITGLIL